MQSVKIDQGLLEGIFCDHGEESYIAFKGIPYAKPPVGKLRFKAPEPPEAWEGIRQAVEHGPVCPQYNERLDRKEDGSEDCLYLNVYTKTLTPTQPLPVMVWIHGGGFYTGSGNSDYYGPEFFMERDVILITFNYRLEVLGFLCLDTEEVPGNAGLKDQVAALKWVKKNISAFGGNPDNITLFGCSAGAASVSYHLVSKMSEGLFSKAICQSGTCLHDWSYNIYPRERAFQLGKLLGLETENSEELLDFLRNLPASSLVKVQLPKLNNDLVDVVDNLLFGPVIEKSNLNVEFFLSECPTDLVKQGRMANVPVIVGYTSGEGIEIGRNIEHLISYFSNTGSVLPRELKLKITPQKLQELDQIIRQRYFNGKDVTIDSLEEVVKFETDVLFTYNTHRYARYHVHFKSTNVYVYEFTAETERNYTKKYYKMESVKGVCHADELPYLFNVTCLDIPLTEDSLHIIRQLVKLWTNFANTGNPTPLQDIEQWKPFTEIDRNCYIIDSKLTCVQNRDMDSFRFWEEIYEETKLG